MTARPPSRRAPAPATRSPSAIPASTPSPGPWSSTSCRPTSPPPPGRPVTTITGAPPGSPTSGSGLITHPVDLPVGGAVIFTFNVLVDLSAPAGPLINTALASFLLNGGVTLIQHIATDTDTLTPQADLAVTIDDHTLIVVPGASDGYTITVTNNGPSTVAVLPCATRSPPPC